MGENAKAICVRLRFLYELVHPPRAKLFSSRGENNFIFFSWRLIFSPSLFHSCIISATQLIIITTTTISVHSAETAKNPSWTQGFQTSNGWESRSDQSWAIKTGITPDTDGHYLATSAGTSTWTYFVTKDGDASIPQITQQQRETFTTKLIANFATSSSTVSTRFIVYVNATSGNDRGWYASAKIEGN